jgi:hypothetical protein
MAVVRWVFTEPATSDTYTVEINPNDGGTPGVAKSFQFSDTCAPDGQTVVFEGRDKPQTMDLSGVILHETHLQALYEWTQKRNPIVIKDDLLREFTVVIEEFTPTRKRSALYPWKHEFRLKATLLVPYAGFV